MYFPKNQGTLWKKKKKNSKVVYDIFQCYTWPLKNIKYISRYETPTRFNDTIMELWCYIYFSSKLT